MCRRPVAGHRPGSPSSSGPRSCGPGWRRGWRGCSGSPIPGWCRPRHGRRAAPPGCGSVPGAPGRRSRGSRPWCGPGAVPRPATGWRAPVPSAGRSARKRRRGGGHRPARAGPRRGGAGSRPEEAACGAGPSSRGAGASREAGLGGGPSRRRTAGDHRPSAARQPARQRTGRQPRARHGRRGPGTSTGGSSPSSAAAAGRTRRSRW